MAFEITIQELTKQANDLLRLFQRTRDKKYKDEEVRIRRIISDLGNIDLGGGSSAATWGSITGTLSSQTDLQSALDAKQATITGAATTIDTENLTASRALVSDGSGKVAVSSVTSTELGYVSGVTSAVQTQVDTKTTKLITTNRQTGTTYPLVLSDADKLVEMNNSNQNEIVIPLNSSVAFPIGTQILVAQYGSGQTIITPTTGVDVRSNGNKRKLNTRYSGATLIKIAQNEWYCFGDLVS